MSDSGALGVVLEQEGEGCMAFQLPLPEGGDKHLEDVHDGAAGALLEAVPLGAGKEERDGEDLGDAAAAVGPAASHLVLDVDVDGDGEEAADADEEEEAVKEVGHLTLLHLVLVV